MRQSAAVFAVAMLATAAAYAQVVWPGGGTSLGQLEYAGSGCRQGTLQAVADPAGDAVVIQLPAFRVQAGGGEAGRVSCNLALPVHVPEGLAVRLLPLALRGQYSLGPDARVEVEVDAFFAGGRAPRYERTFTGPADRRQFFIPSDLLGGNGDWSGCGEDVILRANISLALTTAAGMSTAQLDEVIAYPLVWRSC